MRRPASYDPVLANADGFGPNPVFPGPVEDEPLVPRLGGRVFGEDLCGAILDVTYLDPRCCYRVRVIRFSTKTGWHTVDSKGLSSWEGETFRDTIDVNQMFASGQIELVQESDGAQAKRSRSLSAGSGRQGGAKGSKAVAKVGPADVNPRGRGRGSSKEDREFPLGVNLCGHVIDITYTDPPATYRVKVLSFDRRTGWHKIDSTGLSLWEGDSFRDTVDLFTMHKAGQVRLVPGAGEPAKGGKTTTGRASGRGGRGRGGRGGAGARQGAPGGGRGRGRGGGDAAAQGRKRSPSPGIDSGIDGGRGKRASAGAGVGVANVGLCRPEPALARQPTSLGEDLIGRIVDVTLPNEADGKSGPHRLCIVGFDRVTGCHIVEPLGAEPDDPNEPRSLDLQELTRTGLVELVDGQDELLRYGHVLIGEHIRFLPSEADGGEGDSAWLSATVVGWWPQDVLPPVATQRASCGPRGAVFVAEDADGDRWQLSLHDAVLALVGTPPAAAPGRGARVLEVFAGSCALSVAFWRLGVQAEMYDLRLCERHDFRLDDQLMKQLAQPDLELVHVAPPEGLTLDATTMARLLNALRTVHERGGAFVVEGGQRSGLWTTSEMTQVAALTGVEPLSVDLQDFGAERPAPTRLLTNCAGWLEPALAAGLSAVQPAPATPAMGEGEQYPRAFVDAYAKGAVQALGL